MKAIEAQLFRNAAEDYEIGRPGYPDSVYDYICETLGLDAGDTVVELGSGTGRFTKGLLEKGLIVDAVEPSPEMGRIAAKRFCDREGFRLHCQFAEEFQAQSPPKAIIAAQAAHWFDWPKLIRKVEAYAGGRAIPLVLIWNFRRQQNLFMVNYEKVLSGLSSYRHNHSMEQLRLDEVFSYSVPALRKRFPHELKLEWVETESLLKSYSFWEKATPHERKRVEADLRKVFLAHSDFGWAQMNYSCLVELRYIGMA